MSNQSTAMTYQEAAIRDFQRARKQAAIQQILAHITGTTTELLCYDTVRKQLRATDTAIKHGIQEIPLEKIVGSVGRYEDFTRSFLPKRDADQARWAQVKFSIDKMTGMPPIELYQIGDAYFVQDGNHRVSIAKQLGSKTISANVTEIKTRVPLAAGDDPNEIICKAHYADFLERTNLDRLRPNSDLLMTFCGQYQLLLDQIEAEHSLLENERSLQESSDLWQQAVVDWYDHIYLPVTRIIRELGVMRHFPERTEADMFVLLSERRLELEETLGWHVETETAISNLITEQKSDRSMIDRFVGTMAPYLDDGPAPGLWRKQQLARHRYHHLFADILVALDGSEAGWQIFEHAVKVAQLDRDHLLGLHVVPTKAQLNSKAVQQMRTRFEQRCREMGVSGEFAVEANSSPARVIIKRAAWADMVMVSLNHPPNNQPIARLSSDFKLLVQQCPRPINVIPKGTQSNFRRALLAYDGSRKSDEALFIATYLAARWQRSLTVVTVETEYTTAAAQDQAQLYIEQHGVSDVNYVLEKGPIAETMLKTAASHDCNLLIMGGFSFRSFKDLMVGATVFRVLQEFRHPIIISR